MSADTFTATIYRYTTQRGYEAIGPVLIGYYQGDSCELATQRLAGMADLGAWPAGEYHADLGNGVVAVVDR